MTTPRGSPELVSGQAVPETTVNEQIRRTEAGACHFPVTDRVTAPPGTCSDGANYLIIATATGAFASKENQIATAVEANAAGGWYYHTPIEGFTAWVMDEDIEYQFDGSAWSASYNSELIRDVIGTALVEGAGIDITVDDGGDTITLVVDPSEIEATTAEVWTGTSSAKVITPKILRDASIPTVLTSGASITPDFNAGLNFSLTIEEDANLENPSNAQDGDSGVITITQDGTGGWTLTYASNWKFPTAPPVLSTPPGSIDCLVYYVSASGVILCNLTKDYSS